MYINNKLLIGKNNEKEVFITPKVANRHGIITGASGSGKTITLKVMAESFSDASIPVFLVDVKGDLAGMCIKGVEDEKIKKRIDDLNLENFSFKSFPTHFFDVYQKNGHPIRTTISNIGPKLLSRMLNLSDAQEGVLTIIFKIALDENLEIVDLNDLRALINYVGEKRKEYTLKYGNITSQSIGSILRNLLFLEEDDGNFFFGKPEFNIKDFIKYDALDGRGFINILDATTLFKKPTLYACFLLWILDSLYNEMPEVGDLEKPKLILFIDEAHLLFSEIPSHMIKNIVSIIKLIRSKGIGIYFVSQSPSDIPDEILSQLGNRVQHTLRYYTKNDEKAIKVACNSFRENPNFNMEDAIKSLETGEALVSFLTENGEPNIVDKVTILPPQSKMGTISDDIRNNVIKNSMLYLKYENKINTESILEKINDNKLFKEKFINNDNHVLKKDNTTNKSVRKKKSNLEKASDKITNSALNTIGRKIGNSIFKGLFK